jgi:cardiolipin synthase A/B
VELSRNPVRFGYVLTSCNRAPLRRKKTFRAWGRWTVLPVLLALLCAGCVTPPPDLSAPKQAPPIVARQQVLPSIASEKLLETALGEFADDAEVRALIDSVRAHSSAPLTAGNKVTALVDGPETFAAIRAAIASARHHVHVETFIFGDDELAREFAELLAQKRREGVEVRVLYDSVGSMETAGAFFDELRADDIEVREFRPMNPAKTPLIWKIQNRDHRKIIVVDGKIGFTGGINISGTYTSSSSVKPGPERGVSDGWRDTHIQIEGPAVAQLQELFVQMWTRAGEGTAVCCDAEYFPSILPSGPHLVTIVSNDSEDSEDFALYATYLAAFSKASSRLWITHAYFAPNEDLLQAMSDAAQRGVDVRLIVPGFTDSNIVLHATRSTYGRLLKSGVHIYERNDALLHAKSVVIDGALSIVGSANLDMRSFVHNDEVNAIVISRDFGRRMEQIFRRDEQASRPLDLDTWKQRPLWQRMKELGAKMMGYWL